MIALSLLIVTSRMYKVSIQLPNPKPVYGSYTPPKSWNYYRHYHNYYYTIIVLYIYISWNLTFVSSRCKYLDVGIWILTYEMVEETTTPSATLTGDVVLRKFQGLLKPTMDSNEREVSGLHFCCLTGWNCAARRLDRDTHKAELLDGGSLNLKTMTK
jgi:hypothetical protein